MFFFLLEPIFCLTELAPEIVELPNPILYGNQKIC